jgi:prepilin signal peptidase PulO-like enzyme (type II secretory pathway)
MLFPLVEMGGVYIVPLVLLWFVATPAGCNFWQAILKGSLKLEQHVSNIFYLITFLVMLGPDCLVGPQ